jgi:pimeloyl-ACP methyl ester carboxylesterase
VVRTLVCVLVAVLLLVAGAGQAAAQVSAGACETPSLRGAECGAVGVPLDHSNPLPPPQGRIVSVGYVRFPARRARRGTVVFLAGGPGQSAVRSARRLVDGSLRDLRDRYDIVVMDQRGTGVSSPLRCSVARGGVLRIPSNATVTEAARIVNRCATEIGDDRRFFSTYETVLDLENLRQFLGVPKIIPLGVSYGGQVAGEYARRYPENVAALVLDSTSPIEGVDALGRLPQLALPRVLREVCFPPGCEGLLGDPMNLLRRAVARLQRGALRGRAVLPSGQRRSARITLADLYALVMASDGDPLLRTALPSALEAASRGDAAPLLRLAIQGESGGTSDVNQIRFLATACTEGRLPWAPDSDPATRPALLTQVLRSTAGDFAPFPVGVVATQSTAAQCLGWPATPHPPFPPSPTSGPNIPVLVVGGRDDLRTPLEDQRRAAAQFPTARVIAVPNVGHSVLGSDTTRCGARAVRQFLAGQAVARCEAIEREVPLALPTFPSLSDMPRAAGDAPEKVERTVVAVDLTLRDALRQLAGLSEGSTAGADAAGPRVIRIGGLRGGRLELRVRSVTLVRYEVVPGVRVSGLITPLGRGRLTITGRGATGSLFLSASGRLTGTLDFTPVRYRPLPVGEN